MVETMAEQFSVSHFLWYFVIYAFLGWCAEVAFAAMNEGVFVNRGFLNGPVCPIYGFGMVIVLGVLRPLKSNVLLLFAGAAILTSTLEWVTGFVLEKVFHDKWWDYSEEPFNLNGYVCLKFTVLWGLACVLILDAIHPMIVKLVGWIPPLAGMILLGVLLALFAVDAAVTINAIAKLNRKLAHMNDIAAKLKEVSETLGENISEGVVELSEKKEELDAEAAQRLKELKAEGEARKQELLARYDELANEKKAIQDRLMKAFPRFTSVRHREEMEELRRRYPNLRRKK